jgi:uncharacterized membrane protein YdbT with pleckstrin-like domain
MQSEEYKNLSSPIRKVKPSVKNILGPAVIIIGVPGILMSLFVVMIANFSLIGIISVFVILFVILLVLFFLALPTIMTTYYIDKYRVLSKSGVIYKKQTSVIFEKIDFINSSEGFLNKVFKNGTISINTVGSSRTELFLRDIPNYLDIYKDVKDRY